MSKTRDELKKKKWARPKLIVLARGDRQEEVLLGCKSGAVATTSGNWWGGCMYNSGGCIPCSASGS